MNFIEASVLILFIAVISVPFANRFKIPLEIFLFIGVGVLSLIPGTPHFQINPTIVFYLFLPPILFSAAYFTSWRDFKFNLRPILQLAIGLVIFTMLLVACAVKWLLPAFTWPEAFLIGAIVSPTDASAATAIIKKFDVSRRFMTIIDGESLVNDASALVLYRFAIAAILSTSFSFPQMLGTFVYSSLGAMVVGYFMGVLSIFILKRLKNTEAEIIFSFLTAFASYIIAEHLEFSGVVSTVVAGIYYGIHVPEISRSQTNLGAKATWRTVIFTINGFIFTSIGFQLPSVLDSLRGYDPVKLILMGIALSLVVMLSRIVWIYPSAYLPRLFFPSIKAKDPMPPLRFLFGIGWTGMRGIVSLAAALAIPLEVTDRLPPGHASLIVFFCYFVVVVTLLVPSLSMPFVLTKLHLTDEKEAHLKLHLEANARTKAIEQAKEKIQELRSLCNLSDKLYQELLDQFSRRQTVIATQLHQQPFSSLFDDYVSLKKISVESIKAERDTLLKLRKHGELPDDLFWQLSEELDIEEIRANSLRI